MRMGRSLIAIVGGARLRGGISRISPRARDGAFKPATNFTRQALIIRLIRPFDDAGHLGFAFDGGIAWLHNALRSGQPHVLLAESETDDTLATIYPMCLTDADAIALAQRIKQVVTDE